MNFKPSIAASQSDSPVSGLLVCVVGASGTGKDTLLRGLRRQYSEHGTVRFVTRVITRPADDMHENHESVSEAEFTRRLAEGDFAVHWQAHGLSYGIPAIVKSEVAAGKIAIVNGSRAAIPSIVKAFPRYRIVHVVVDTQLRETRLQNRGRETAADIDSRINRRIKPVKALDDAWILDNSGEPDVAINKLVDFVGRQLLELSATRRHDDK